MTKNNFRFSVLAYFLISVVLHGLQRSCGLFVLILLQSWSTDRQHATMPFAVNWAVANIIASFSDSLIEKKKSERAVLFGVLITALGAGLCVLSTDESDLIISWGFIFGSGYGIASPHLSRFLHDVKSPKLHFFLQATPSFGVLVMPFIIHSLASYYGLQSSYLIISGIILNYLPLSIAAAFNITFDLPNFNWRVRKKSKQYVVSKLEKDKHISEESFVNSLEPELILQINQNDEFLEETYGDGIDNFVLSMNESLSVGRKRTETRGHDLQGLQEDPKISCRLLFGRKRTETRRHDLQGLEIDPSFMSNTHSLIDVAMQKNGKENNHINSSFSNDTTYTERDKAKRSNAKHNDTCNSMDKMENIILDPTAIGVVNKISESPNKYPLNNAYSELDKGNSSELKIESVNKLATPECEISQTLNADKKSDTFLGEKEDKLLTKDKSFLEINTENSSSFDNKLKIPFEIKVHVEECTFINDGKQWFENAHSTYKVDTKNNNDDPLNLLMSKSQANFAGQKFSKSFHNSSEPTMSKQLNIYSISEKIEPDDKQIAKEQNIKDTKQNINVATTLKIKKILKFFNELTSPGCLCITLITIIFEMNLVVLITMFADFGNDIDSECSDLKWILAAFGVGGLAGNFCCYKISRTTPEKSHAIGVILFLLTGLSTAGLVFSTNVKWLAGFYSILGALEGGITYTIPKFVSQYVDINMLSTFTFVKRFLSGAAVIGIPYAIGLSRDELDDYELLLQVLSCSSILCAFLVYFLPYLSTSSDRKLTSFTG